MEIENLETIINCHERLNQGDIDAALNYFAEDTSNHGVPVGREGIKMVLDDIYKTFPNWRFEIAEIIAKDDSVVVRTIVSGIHLGKGEFPVNGGMLAGVDPTGKKFEAQHIPCRAFFRSKLLLSNRIGSEVRFTGKPEKRR